MKSIRNGSTEFWKKSLICYHSGRYCVCYEDEEACIVATHTFFFFAFICISQLRTLGSERRGGYDTIPLETHSSSLAVLGL